MPLPNCFIGCFEGLLGSSESKEKPYIPLLKIDEKGQGWPKSNYGTYRDRDGNEQTCQYEYETYSITPRTFQGRSYIAATDVLFTEYYEYKGNQVTRFGIGMLNPPQVEQRPLAEKKLGLTERDLKPYIKLPQVSDSSASPSPSTSQTSDAPSKKENTKAYQVAKSKSEKLLTEIEFENTKKALSHLKQEGVRTVVVDILERDSAEALTGGTHAVVLYKNPKINAEVSDEFLAIDPNNSSFSHVLITADPHLKVCLKELQIYKVPPDSSAAPCGWRDCIDVAIKLAFHLNVKGGIVNLKNLSQAQTADAAASSCEECIEWESLKAHKAVQAVTNQQGTLKVLPKLVESNSVREKQSSDYKSSDSITVRLVALENSYRVVLGRLDKLKIFGKLEERFEDLMKEVFVEHDKKSISDNYGNRLFCCG